MTEPLRVLFTDADFLVVDKPPGLPIRLEGAGDSLLVRARAFDRRAPLLVPVSRLRPGLSGIVTFVRTERGLERARQNRALGRFDREYLALLSRAPLLAAGEWTSPIPFVREGRIETVPAVTEYETREALAVGALVALRPRTGLVDQLRVHARDACVPIVGDDDGRGERPMIHAVACILAPVEGELVRLVAEPPSDFRAAYEALGGRALPTR